jgi:hypothetical protein
MIMHAVCFSVLSYLGYTRFDIIKMAVRHPCILALGVLFFLYPYFTQEKLDYGTSDTP